MKKILRESYQDIEIYLRSPDLISQLVVAFGENLEDYGQDVTDYVVDTVQSNFGEDISIKSDEVLVCKVVDEDVDILSTNHSVVNYNGYYYDYLASEFNDSFDDLINIDALPVVQLIIHSDNQISNKLSTVKGYTLLGY